MLQDELIDEKTYFEAKNEDIILTVPEKKKNDYVETYVYECATKAIMAKKGFVFKTEFQNLEEKEQMQISLFNQTDTEKEKQRKVDKAVDAIKEKFGYEMITRAGKMKVGKLLRTDKE